MLKNNQACLAKIKPHLVIFSVLESALQNFDNVCY